MIDLGILRYLPQLKVVVTGDSLSYNRYSYDEIARATALEGKNGYKSWSWQLRDAFLANLPGFAPGTEFIVPEKMSDCAKTVIMDPFEAPLGNRCLRIHFTQIGQKIVLTIPKHIQSSMAGRQCDELFLYFVTSIHAGGRFRVTVEDAASGLTLGGTEQLDNRGNANRYRGVELRSERVCGNANAISLNLIIEALAFEDDREANLYLVGCAASQLQWENTGRGSTTSEWLKNEFQSLVIDHRPQLTLIITGANDYTQSLKEEDTYRNVKTMVEAILQQRQSHVVLITRPPSGNHSDERTYPYAQSVLRVADETGCGCMDLYELFRPFDPSFWRYDNIHFNRRGNQMVFEHLVRHYFPSLDIRSINQYNHYQ
jgi:hypothetical protein